jgi:restriction system protein
MSRHSNRRGGRHATRKILGLAVFALGIGGGLLATSLILGASASPMLQAASQGIRLPVPYAVMAGLVLLVLYIAVRPRPDPYSASKLEPTYFGKDTTNFASQLDSRALDRKPEPAQNRGERGPALVWSARVFEDMEWRRFEAVCTSLFAQADFEARTQSHGPDGGVDIWLYARNAAVPAAVVQCMHRLGKPVGVQELREFLSVLASHQLQRGTFATSSSFTSDARQFARESGISALDGLALLALISQRTPEQQQALLQIAYEGEYWRPTCASCGLKMVERTARKKDRAFWGCADYPRCGSTLPMRSIG